MSGTEKTPEVVVFDDSFLKDVNREISNSFNRLSISDFKKYWAERFFGNPTEDKSEYLHEWEYQVALSRTAPVFITGDDGKDKWIFPPIMGTLKSRFTANENSMATLRSQVEVIRKRITRQGMQAEEVLYSHFSPNAQDSTFSDINMFMLRRECGYLTSEEEQNFQRIMGQVNIVSDNTDDSQDSTEDEEFDY